MYRLFNRPIARYGTLSSPQVPRIKDFINGRVNYTESLQEIAGQALSGDHLLIQLCYRLSSYLKYSDIYGSVDDTLDKLCNPLGITNNYGKGRVHRKFVYTEYNAIIATTFDDQFTTTPWKEVRAIRVLDHPFTSMEIFIPPLGRNISSDGKVSVIGIDLPLFAYQLKAWNSLNVLLPEDEQESLAAFITKYVIPRMINEYIDIAVRNRLRYIVNREVMPRERHERSFVVVYEGLLEKPIKNAILAMKTSNKPYAVGLSNVPFIYSTDYLSAVPLEIASLSTYSYWVIFYTFVNWAHPLTYLVDNSKDNSLNMVTVLHRVDRLVKGGYLSTMNDIMLTESMEKYKKIKEFFGA